MTEAEWLGCPAPLDMLDFQRRKLTDRKRRLFVAAVARDGWNVLTDEGSRQAIETAERFADEQVTREQLDTAERRAWRVSEEALRTMDWPLSSASWVACCAASRSAPRAARKVAAVLLPGGGVNRIVILRDIIGNPFRPVPSLDPSVLAWNDGPVPRIAQAIYDERRFGDMPVLADALLDAGCDDEALIAHCRSAGPHLRGCWAVDRILGKS
jgi:hypothetical protein